MNSSPRSAEAPPLRRRLITIDGRRVHYLRMGSGPPVVLVHSSPTNAWYVLPHMRLLAERHTCFAFDTPGFGLSEPLPGNELAVGDLSAAIAENMAAVGLPACPVFGTHTGAAIALSLAANHPERVTALMLDAVPIFSAQDRAELMDGYFEALEVDARGGHYARTWTRFRDQYVWFPWTRKTPDRLNETDVGPPAALQAWMMSFFYAGRTYKPAYRSAWTYGEQAVVDARALRCPAVFTAAETDMLYPHLDRLPALRAGQEIRLIGNDRALKDALIAEVFERWAAAGPAPDAPFALTSGPGIRQQFVDLPSGGQVLLRHAGRRDAPALLLLHDAPGSGLMHEALIASLAEGLLVIAPDLPGCGGSDPMASATNAEPSLADFADAVAEACAQAGIARACVYGIGLGASVALVLAERHPQLAASLILCSPPLPDDAQRAELKAHDAPRITLQPDGSHWYRTWLMLRDRRVWFPWFEPRSARLRRVATDLDGDALHDATFELMKQHASYHQFIDAVWAHDAAASLATLSQPLRLCHDPQVPTFAHNERLRALCPEVEPMAVEGAEHAREVIAFVVSTVPQPSPQPSPTSGRGSNA